MKNGSERTAIEQRAADAFRSLESALTKAGVTTDQQSEEAALIRMFERMGRGDMLDQLTRD